MALSEENERLRVGSGKRSANRLVKDLARFDGHIERFAAAFPHDPSWTVERVAIAPRLDAEHRRAREAAGYVAQDLADLTAEPLP